MNDITIFNHLGNDIRVMADEQGEPWFVLNDICGALGITYARRMSSMRLASTKSSSAATSLKLKHSAIG